MFNAGGYWEKTLTGELTAVIERERCPALLLAGEPLGTRSQQVSYYNAQGTEIARVHQYLRPDGSIGLSGKPDPKRLFENGVLYRIEKSQTRTENLTSPVSDEEKSEKRS
jgi:hypothetical protein